MFRIHSIQSVFSNAVYCMIFGVLLTASPVHGQWDPPAGFYLTAVGTGQTLKDRLTMIMSSGHIQRTYGNFRFSAAIHDQDPNNSSRILLVYNRASVNGSWDSGVTWNREHVWPQARQPGTVTNNSQGNLGDPHALRPANPGINANRENKPFGFANTSGSFANLGQYWYPGDECRGDIARSLFYSDTRWTALGLSLTDSFPSGNQMGDLSSIVAWHYLDPPDEFERRRNHTIFSSAFNPQYFTNNRNAFIDRPGFVWSIYVDQENDSQITVTGGIDIGGGSTTMPLDFGAIIVGAAIPANQAVQIAKNGLDGTYYSINLIGDAVSNVSGSHNAFRSNGTDSRILMVGLDFDPSQPGTKTGLIEVDNLDVTSEGGAGRGSNDGNDFIVPTIDVFDHSNASFSSVVDDDILQIDLGTIVLGQPIVPQDIEVANLASVFGEALTADLDLDSIESPSGGGLEVSGQLFTGLAAGQSEFFQLVGTPDKVGNHADEFCFFLTDENLSGALAQQITLTVTYEVVGASLPGDVNGDGVINLLDVSPFVQLLATGGFQIEADINSDGIVNLLDVEPFIELLTGN